MIIYCDGSSDVSGVIGWGIIAQHNGTLKELTGNREVSQHYKNLHEMFAFVEAVLYAHKNGLQPHEVSFYTDDQALVYSANYHNVVSWGETFDISPRMRQALDDVAKFYPDGTVELVLSFFEHSHIVWVKGHAGNFMNMRVDHLAKRAMRRLKSRTSKHKIHNDRIKIVPFFEWFKDLVATMVTTMKRHFIPFSDALINPKIPNLLVVSHITNYHTHNLGLPYFA